MQREDRTDVTVAGAGPVGMLTALLLAEEGIKVRIFDQEARPASRTYACALHPHTLNILDRLGLSRDVLEIGLRVGKVAFYEGDLRRAEVNLAQLSSKFPFVVVLPQSAFEELLQERLRQHSHVQVDWNHRLANLRTEGDTVVASVEKLGASAKGYIIPEMEWSVQKAFNVRASYVVGADGPNSFVAHSLGFGTEAVGEPEFFAVYEFASDSECSDELRVVLDEHTTSVLWPLPGKKFRWSFQLLEEHQREFPAKERSALVIDDPALERANHQFVEKLVRERAPWFKGQVAELNWSTDVAFCHRVSVRFGQQRCWLAGDAAHQTSPAGMQSMNIGLLEAEQLAAALIQVFRQKAAPSTLEEYNEHCRKNWRRLLGLDPALRSNPAAHPWVRQRSSRILSSLPASGADLTQLLKSLGLDLS